MSLPSNSPGGAFARARHWHFLTSVPLLKCLNMDELGMICDVIEIKKFADGDTIIRQGDAGHEFYIISSGQCTVRKSASPGQPEAKELQEL